MPTTTQEEGYKRLVHLSSEVTRQIGEDNKKQIELFLITFSRFEYALTQNGYVYRNIYVDWQTYGDAINNKFKPDDDPLTKKAFDELKSRPPKEKKSNLPATVAGYCDAKKAVVWISTIRNNLFHGSKTLFEIPRDPDLIRYSLILLDYCLSISSDGIKNAFWDGLTSYEKHQQNINQNT